MLSQPQKDNSTPFCKGTKKKKKNAWPLDSQQSPTPFMSVSS